MSAVDPTINEADEFSFANVDGGVLVIVATPIGNIGDISPRAIEALRSADLVCCEDTRHSGQLLKRLGVHAERLMSLHAHNEAQRAPEIVQRLNAGERVVLISDAGTPLISDPGERIVAHVLDAGLPVTTVPGPSAVIAALSVSGMALDRWCFHGFLPRKGPERRERLGQIANSAVVSVVYEAPQRVDQTLLELAEQCGPNRQVVVARELTKLHEEVWRGSLGDAAARNDAAPRGEHVIVIGPVERERNDDEVKVKAALEQLIAAGLGRRDAVTAIELLLGVAHRTAYQAALEIGSPSK